MATDNTNKPATGSRAPGNPSSNTPTPVYNGVPPTYVPKEPGFTPVEEVPIGGVIPASGPIEYNTDRYTVKVTVHNTGDRPIQVGSHFHFFEVNRYLEFDRPKAFGCHLNIPATTAIRFEPGDEKEVELVSYSGKRKVLGFNGLANGYTGGEDSPTYYPTKTHAIRKMEEYGFKSVSDADAKLKKCNPSR